MKNNTWFRILLRVWIAMTSVAAFIGGWAFFGHSGKPVSASDAILNPDPQVAGPVQVTPLPTLAPLPTFNGQAANIQPLPQQQLPQVSQPSFQFSQPRLRSRGS